MNRRHRAWSSRTVATIALAIAALAAPPATAGDRPPDLLGMARVNNLSQLVSFRIDARQRHVSELRVRSGSLSMHVVAVEIRFADGTQSRILPDEILAPGHPSRAIAVDRRRAIAEVTVVKRPGLRPGETAIQLLGKVEAPPAGAALPRTR